MAGGAAGAALLGLLLGGAPALAPHAESPPAGFTGGFGEDDCTVCHLEAGPNLPGGSLELLGLPRAYGPGERYQLEVVLRAEGTERAGFQLSARRPDGSPAGRLVPVDGRVQVLAPDSLAAEYAAQTPAGSHTDDPDGARWVLLWTAPRDSGEVRVHLAANSGNGDDSPLGDLVYTLSRETRAAP